MSDNRNIMDELTDALQNPKLQERRRLPVPDQLNGQDIKRYRKELGLTQGELSLVLAEPKHVIRQWEQGTEAPPGMIAWALRYVAISLDPRREII